ncbi:ATP-binding protein [Shewanella sp. Isolate13]|uniref:ATP-binding protein n=1 Tax=Shewanella sp. Isolate13 TaxID=2908531 RepID=UPI001EFDE48C|nr:ATP-binding protein [Shewanella sp. Isolate13]MCG9730989.1 ATP-binding protein [Shewanella sp. Isolate13]
MNSLQFNLNRNIFANHSISKEIEQFMLQNEVSDTKRFKVITCVLEAVSNIFTHAAPKINSLIIILHCDHQQIVIDLLDNSQMQPFTPPTDCPPAEAISGRGLWIIKSWMDNVRIQETVAGTHLQFSIAV